MRVERSAELQVTVLTRLVREIFRNTCVPNKVASAQLELIQTSLERAGEPLLHHLIQLCLTELRRTPSETCYRGLPLLGKLLEVASCRETLTPDPAEGVKVSGLKYKTRLLEEVCALEWGADRVAGLTVMFLELRLADDELRLVFTKLLSSLKELPTQSLPPLVHQLLLLSRNSGEMAALLLHRLTDFFSSKLSLAERQEVTNPDLESMEIGGSDQAVEDLMQAEGTVVYHVTAQAARGHPVSREVVRLVKAATRAPEVCLHSFSLMLSLALTSARQLQDQLLDLLSLTVSCCFQVTFGNTSNTGDTSNTLVTLVTLTVSCCFQLEQGRKDSAWLRTVLPRAGDVSDLLTQVTLVTAPCSLYPAPPGDSPEHQVGWLGADLLPPGAAGPGPAGPAGGPGPGQQEADCPPQPRRSHPRQGRQASGA